MEGKAHCTRARNTMAERGELEGKIRGRFVSTHFIAAEGGRFAVW